MLGFERIGGFVLDGVFHDEGHGEHGDTAGGRECGESPLGQPHRHRYAQGHGRRTQDRKRRSRRAGTADPHDRPRPASQHRRFCKMTPEI